MLRLSFRTVCFHSQERKSIRLRCPDDTGNGFIFVAIRVAPDDSLSRPCMRTGRWRHLRSRLSSQKTTFGFQHSVKMEFRKGLVHERLDAVVTKIAHRSFMGMMDMLVSFERTVLNLQSHFLISISERHAGSSQLVHLFHREHRVVHRVVEYMLVHCRRPSAGSR